MSISIVVNPVTVNAATSPVPSPASSSGSEKLAGNESHRMATYSQELLDATANFRRVAISFRTQFFPEGENDPFCRLGKLEIGGHVCPTVYLSPFTENLNRPLRLKNVIVFFFRVSGRKSVCCENPAYQPPEGKSPAGVIHQVNAEIV